MGAVLNRIDRAVGRCEYALLVLLMAALTLILVAQVVCRYFFGSPIFLGGGCGGADSDAGHLYRRELSDLPQRYD